MLSSLFIRHALYGSRRDEDKGKPPRPRIRSGFQECVDTRTISPWLRSHSQPLDICGHLADCRPRLHSRRQPLETQDQSFCNPPILPPPPFRQNPTIESVATRMTSCTHRPTPMGSKRISITLQHVPVRMTMFPQKIDHGGRWVGWGGTAKRSALVASGEADEDGILSGYLVEMLLHFAIFSHGGLSTLGCACERPRMPI